jgi:hypothetical protein
MNFTPKSRLALLTQASIGQWTPHSHGGDRITAGDGKHLRTTTYLIANYVDSISAKRRKCWKDISKIPQNRAQHGLCVRRRRLSGLKYSRINPKFVVTGDAA